MNAMRVLIILLLLGCGSLLPATPRMGAVEPADCRGYDDSYLAWHAVSLAASGLAGATATTGALTAALADSEGADIAVPASAAVLGALAVVADWLAGEYATRTAECVRGERP